MALFVSLTMLLLFMPLTFSFHAVVAVDVHVRLASLPFSVLWLNTPWQSELQFLSWPFWLTPS
jgi:hypothetical protein